MSWKWQEYRETYMLENLAHPADKGLLVRGVQPLQRGRVTLVLHNGQLLQQQQTQNQYLPTYCKSGDSGSA